MTRKDFNAIADALLRSRPVGYGQPHACVESVQFERSVEQVTAALAAANPRFDRERFMAAAGVVA